MKRKKIVNRKLAKKTLIAFLALLVLVPLTYFLVQPKNAEADWYDTNWSYRQAVTVTVTSGASDITNLETLLTVNTSALISAKLQSSCQDLRFTSATGKLLPYYIDSGCNTTTTKVWVMADLVPKNTTTYIMYMYYGNPTAVAGTDATKFRLFNGLVGYWTMNEASWNGTASEVKDSSVKGLNGTASHDTGSNPNTSAGNFGNAGSFNSANQSFVQVTNPGATLKPTSVSVGAWIKTSTTGAAIAVGGFGDSYTVELNSSGFSHFVVATASSTWISTDGTVNLANNSWHFLVDTYNSTNQSTQLYVDGVLVNTKSLAAPIYYSNGTNFIIGRNGNSASNYWTGLADDFRVYNRVLSQAEISQLYQNPGTIATTVTTTSLPSTSFGSETQAPGPIAYWKFDDGTGTSAKDSSSNNNTGTLSGSTVPTWQTEDQCISSKCLYFNGANSYVSASPTSLANQTTGAIALWAKVDTNTQENVLFTTSRNADSTVTDLSMSYDLRGAGRNFYIILRTDGTTQWFYQVPTSFMNFTNEVGKWHYFSLVQNGTAPVLYVDGIVAPLTANITTNTTKWFKAVLTDATNKADTLSIGGYRQNGAVVTTVATKGFIDEPKIYNYPRSAAQIQSDFNSRGSQVAAANALGASSQNNAALNNGLVGYWKMDESSGNAADSSGNGNTGTNANTATYTTGKFGNSGTFNGSNQSFSMGSPTSISNVTGAVTISAWVYPTTSGTTEGIAGGCVDATAGNAFCLRENNGNFALLVSSTAPTLFTAIQGTSAPTNQWSHVVGTFDGSKLMLYVNGALVATTNFSGTRGSLSSFGFNIADVRSGNEYFTGSVDETRLYNRALSPAEVQTLYNFAPGPVAYYNFEEGSGSTINDRSGNGNTASWVSTAQYSPGKYGAAGNFNGSSNYVNANHPASIATMGTTTSFSLGAWVNYPSNAAGNFPGIAGNLVNSATAGYNLLVYSTNDTHFNTIYAQVGDGTNNVQIIPTTNWADGKWHYAAMVVDRAAQTVTLYVDGVSQGSSSISTVGAITTTNDFNIGTRSGSPYLGKVDEVRFYNYAETQKQVISDMAGGSPSTSSGRSGGPTGYWKFDEGQGTTSNNSGNGGSALNGTLNTFNSPAVSTSGWNQNGKFGKALAFDGTSDYVNVPDTTALQLTTTGSVSVWVNPSAYPTSGNWSTILNKGNWSSGRNDYSIYYTGTGSTIRFEVDNGATQYSLSVTNTYSPLNKWTHLVMSWDGATIRAYANSMQIGSLAMSGSPNTSTYALQVGAANAGRFYSGLIDEVKLYPYPLSPSDIQLDYNRSSSEVLGATSNTLTNGLVGYWAMDETSYNNVSGEAKDSSGNNNNGTGVGYSSTSLPAGKYGNAGTFNGSTQYVSIPDASSIDPTSQATFSFWINTATPFTSTRELITKGAGQQLEIFFSGTTGQIQIVVYGLSSATGPLTSVIPANTWTHVVFTYDGAHIKAFINGVFISQTSNTGSINTNAAALLFGKRSDGFNFNGQLDDVRIYNRALSTGEVNDLYQNSQSGFSNTGTYCVPGDSSHCETPVGEWNFEEGSGSSVNDTSGNGNTGTWNGTGSPHYKPGPNNSTAGNFNGANDYVSVSATSTLNNLTNQTISGWINLTRYDASNSRITDKTNSGGNNGAQFRVNSSGTLEALTGGYSTTNPDSVSSNTIPLNRWTYVTAIFNNSTLKWSLYINGTEVSYSAQTAGVGSAPNDSANSFGIGAAIAANTRFLLGQIDQVRVYNYVRTGAQVAWDYNRGGPVGWWKLDDCQGSVAIDSSGNARTATISLTPAGTTTLGTCTTSSSFWGGSGGTGAGKINYAPTFDGTDDIMTTSAFSPLTTAAQTTTKFSWGGWFFPTTSVASKTLMEKATEFQLTTNSSSQPLCGVYYSAAFHNSSAPTQTLTLSAWNHVLCVYDGTNISTYLNGILIKQSAETNTVTAASSILYFAETSGGANFYKGQIDDARIYNYALTQTQIRDLYNGGSVRFAPGTGSP